MKPKATAVGLMVAAMVGGALFVESRVAARETDGAPAAVRDAARRLFPDGQIDEVVTDRRVVELYELTLNVGGRKRSVTVAADGTVMGVEREIGRTDAPEPVRAALERLERRGRITELEIAEIHADLGAIRLAQPRTEYEVELMVGGRVQKVRVSADGRIDDERDDDRDDEADQEDDDGEDDDEEDDD